MRESVKDHVARMRRDAPDRQVLFNCTGAFKAECAVLYALGLELRIPVYYLHESFKVCVTLPGAETGGA